MNLQSLTIDIGHSDIAIYRTAIRMAALIKQFASIPFIRQKAENIINGVKQYDSLGEVEAIYNYVQQNLRYTRDPLNWEYIKQPDLMIKEIDENGSSAGDCDEYVVLSLTLCRSIGYPTVIKIASYSIDREFTHVYGMVLVHNQWIVFDAIKEQFKYVESIPSLAYFL